jgi:hypothetical protein
LVTPLPPHPSAKPSAHTATQRTVQS